MGLQAAPEETVHVADMLIAAGWLTTGEEVADFFRKPGKWQQEADAWSDCGSPVATDAGWELFEARLDRLDAGA